MFNTIKELRIYAKDHTTTEIMEHFNCSLTTVYRYINAYDIQCKRKKVGRPLKNNIYTPSDIELQIINDYKKSYPTMNSLSNKYHTTPQKICKILQNNHVNRSRRDINKEKIENYLKENRPVVNVMSQDLQLSKSCIRQILHIMNVKTEAREIDYV